MTPRTSPPSSIALFGGVFDPIHAGHLAVARAAVRRFHLDAVHFIPSARPPHKRGETITAFEHRYAMTALACAAHPRFFPSLAEADSPGGSRFSYTIDTVRRFRHRLAGHRARLYFIIGADAFLQIAAWKHYRSLLDSCDFIVVHRPGYPARRLAEVIPEDLRARPQSPSPSPLSRRGPGADTIALRGSAVHFLRSVSSHVSSTEIRLRRRQGRSIRTLVPPLVEEYMQKQALYCR